MTGTIERVGAATGQGSRGKGPRQAGFVFSLDATIAVVILIAAMFLLVSIQRENPLGSGQSTTIAEDTLYALESSGYIVQTIDTNAPSQAALLIRQQLLAYLPKGFDANVTVTAYTPNNPACPSQQSFKACFPDANKTVGTAGTMAPATTSAFVSGKKFYVRKQPPGDCNLAYASFSSEDKALDYVLPQENVEAEFSSAEFFPGSDANVNFGVSVSPSKAITCDQNVHVTLDVNNSNGTRNQIDLVMVLSRTMTTTDLNAETTDMANFYTNAIWSTTNDQIALATYDKQGHNKNPLKNPIDNATLNNITNLSQYNDLTQNAVADGVQTGLAYITPGAQNYRTNSSKFLIVLTDNNDTSTDTNLAAQASSAKSLGVSVFPVSIGPNPGCGSGSQLQQLASTTGGICYNASDANALQALSNTIAQQVVQLAFKATDSNVEVPLIGGSGVIVDLNGGTLQPDGNILWHSGSTIGNAPWTVTYTLNFPCSLASVCKASSFTFPAPGSTFNYLDAQGNYHSIDFNASTTVPFQTRDLNVAITSGSIISPNSILLSSLVTNAGQLDANSTTMRFRLNDTNGALLASYNVPALCSLSTPGCTTNTASYSQVNLNTQGIIYATINDDKSMNECPAGNYYGINCYNAPSTQVWSVQYYAWRN